MKYFVVNNNLIKIIVVMAQNNFGFCRLHLWPVVASVGNATGLAGRIVGLGHKSTAYGAVV